MTSQSLHPISRTTPLTASHGLRFEESRFWITHRRREFGPFDYEWSPDLRGLELTYRGHKFGEICSEDQFYADLREFRLPMRVVELATLTLGYLLTGILQGLPANERRRLLAARLRHHGFGNYWPLPSDDSDSQKRS